MKRGRRDGRPLQYAAARAALWLLNDLPAQLETVLFPDNVRRSVSLMLLSHPTLTCMQHACASPYRWSHAHLSHGGPVLQVSNALRCVATGPSGHV